MSCRSLAAILAIAVGISTISAAQATQVANGLSANGLSANGTDAQGHLRDTAVGTTQVEAVILQDGSTIPLN